MFFSSDFNFAHPDTFAAVCGAGAMPASQVRRALLSPPPPLHGSHIPQALVLQERLSGYTDAVELQLQREICARSDSFFSALSVLTDLSSGISRTRARVASLRATVRGLDEAVLGGAGRVARASRARRNALAALSLLASAHALHTATCDLQLLVASGDFSAAADVLDELRRSMERRDPGCSLSALRTVLPARIAAAQADIEALLVAECVRAAAPRGAQRCRPGAPLPRAVAAHVAAAAAAAAAAADAARRADMGLPPSEGGDDAAAAHDQHAGGAETSAAAAAAAAATAEEEAEAAADERERFADALTPVVLVALRVGCLPAALRAARDAALVDVRAAVKAVLSTALDAVASAAGGTAAAAAAASASAGGSAATAGDDGGGVDDGGDDGDAPPSRPPPRASFSGAASFSAPTPASTAAAVAAGAAAAAAAASERSLGERLRSLPLPCYASLLAAVAAALRPLAARHADLLRLLLTLLRPSGDAPPQSHAPHAQHAQHAQHSSAAAPSPRGAATAGFGGAQHHAPAPHLLLHGGAPGSREEGLRAAADGVCAVADAAAQRWAKLLLVRAPVHARLRGPDFASSVWAPTVSFADALDAAASAASSVGYSGGGIGAAHASSARPGSALLRSTLAGQARALLAAAASSAAARVAGAMETEPWARVDPVPPDFQACADLIARAHPPPSPSLLLSHPPTAPPRPPSTGVALNGVVYAPVASVLVLLRGLASLAQLGYSLPPLAPEALQRAADAVAAFNARTCDAVLGAGALAGAGLPRITARHIALASQSLALASACLAAMRAGCVAGGGLPRARAALLLPQLDRVDADVARHRGELAAKLLSISRERLAPHGKALAAAAAGWQGEAGGAWRGGASAPAGALVAELALLCRVLSPLLLPGEAAPLFGRIAAAADRLAADALGRRGGGGDGAAAAGEAGGGGGGSAAAALRERALADAAAVAGGIAALPLRDEAVAAGGGGGGEEAGAAAAPLLRALLASLQGKAAAAAEAQQLEARMQALREEQAASDAERGAAAADAAAAAAEAEAAEAVAAVSAAASAAAEAEAEAAARAAEATAAAVRAEAVAEVAAEAAARAREEEAARAEAEEEAAAEEAEEERALRATEPKADDGAESANHPAEVDAEATPNAAAANELAEEEAAAEEVPVAAASDPTNSDGA